MQLKEQPSINSVMIALKGSPIPQGFSRRFVRGLKLLNAAQGVDRLTLALYLAWDFLNYTVRVPVVQREMNLNLSGLRLTTRAFSAQLGGYVDVFVRRVYEKLPEFSAQTGQVIVDAGANVGFYTLRQAKAVGSSGKVYAFEPNPDVYPLLIKNICQNGLNWVSCFPEALSSQEGTFVFKASRRGTSTGQLAQGMSAKEGEILVHATTLDAFCQANGIRCIDVLKMDTEGAEAEIVRGGLEHTLPVTKRVVMESHNTRYLVRDLLAPLGFSMVLDDRSTHTVYFEHF